MTESKIKYLEYAVSEVNNAGNYEGGSSIEEFTDLQKEVIAENYDVVTRYFKGCFTELMELDYKAIRRRYKKYNIIKNVSEKELEDFIIGNWTDYFPKYEFVDNQVKCKQGTLDILAKDKESGRDVIVELKAPTKDRLNRQLLDYSTCYDNPILVGVNSRDKNKLKEIVYMDIDLPKGWLDEYNKNAYSDLEKYEIAKEIDKFLSKIHLVSVNEVYREVINTENHRIILLNAYLNGYTNIEGIIDEYLMWTDTWFLNRDLNISRIQKMTFREYVDECLSFVFQGFIIEEGNQDELVNRFNIYEAYKDRYVTLSMGSFLSYVNGFDYTGSVGDGEFSYDLIDKDYNVDCHMVCEDTFILHSDKYKIKSKEIRFEDVHPDFKKELLINEIMNVPQGELIKRYFLSIENEKEEKEKERLLNMSIEELDKLYGLAF